MRALLLALLMSGATHCAPASPFATLRQAYAERDAARAASAYTAQARFRADEPGLPQPWQQGREVIERQFRAWFAAWDAPADLNFRAATRTNGLYRLAVGAQQVCGRYTVRLAREAGRLRFASDLSEPVDCVQFHAAPGPLMFDDAYTPLDAGFHDALLGRYAGPGDCIWRITRSAWRLQWEDACSGERRSLTRQSGWQWQAQRASGGAGWRFEPDALWHAGHRAARLPALEQPPQALAVPTDDGQALGATLRRPQGAGPWPGVVLLHGSGPQDRHGYAGLMRRLGDALVEAGVAVLVYDKRGHRALAGEVASFARLGADARAALALLRAQPGIDAARTGLVGSSQAGWVAAKAVQQGAEPAFVLLLMAAGSAVSVEQQVLHHSAQQLRCQRLPQPAIEAVLAQQRGFFAARRGEGSVPTLPLALRAWALPGADDGPTAWHRVLELDFDPLPVWQAYRGRLTLLLAEHDEATPSQAIAARLPAHMLPGANHLGLLTHSPCTPMTEATRWHPALWPALRREAAAISGRVP